MLAVLGMMVFAGAFLVTVAVIAGTLVPELPRILRLLAGEIDAADMPAPVLILTERRAALRNRSLTAYSWPPLREAA